MNAGVEQERMCIIKGNFPKLNKVGYVLLIKIMWHLCPTNHMLTLIYQVKCGVWIRDTICVLHVNTSPNTPPTGTALRVFESFHKAQSRSGWIFYDWAGSIIQVRAPATPATKTAASGWWGPLRYETWEDKSRGTKDRDIGLKAVFF